MNIVAQKEFLANFAGRYGSADLFSTGAQRVNYNGVLYNVDGSSTDPKIDSESWRGLLISYGINAPCYVSNKTPSDNSHPNFSVGGHMTPNADGKVELGSDSYLMPLCSWHNSKARDGIAFNLNKTLILKLSGFMQHEIAATFMARLPSEKTHSIVYAGGDSLMCSDLSETEAKAAKLGHLSEDALSCKSNDYLLLRRFDDKAHPYYRIEHASVD